LSSDGIRLRWSYHFGFPAASLDEPLLLRRYQIITAAAICLSNRAGPVSLASIRETIEHVSDAPDERLDKAGGALFPEIAAAVAGFAHSQRRENGLYAMIDVGAGTLDCCTFNLAQDMTGTVKCPVFAADVAPLGVEPSRACEAEPTKSAEFRKALDEHPKRVIWKTRQHRYRESPRWQQGLPLFLIGGGASSPVHRSSANSLDAWLRYQFRGHNYPNPGVRILELPFPTLLGYTGGDRGRHRLAVAVGLSLPSDQIPEVELPSAIPNESRAPMVGVAERFIGKEHV
jgi:hypothetical protein